MSLRQECINLAQRFRLGHHLESAQHLPVLIEKVLTTIPVSQHANIAGMVAAMLACQERSDWLGLADWLEGELVMLLDSATQEGRDQ
ncbi:hypothetical protein [Aeromonas intestinalis]